MTNWKAICENCGHERQYHHHELHSCWILTSETANSRCPCRGFLEGGEKVLGEGSLSNDIMRLTRVLSASLECLEYSLDCGDLERVRGYLDTANRITRAIKHANKGE